MMDAMACQYAWHFGLEGVSARPPPPSLPYRIILGVRKLAKNRQPAYKAFELILYPDDPSFEDRMRYLQETYSTWAWILHDKDVKRTVH